MKLDHNLIKNVSNPRSPHISGTYGFTMIETLVAGVILLVVLVVVSRISILSITRGAIELREIDEAAIQNNIQVLQQADTQLTFILYQLISKICMPKSSQVSQRAIKPKKRDCLKSKNINR